VIRFIANTTFNKYQASSCETAKSTQIKLWSYFCNMAAPRLDDPEYVVNHMCIFAAERR
jgi:hypothetical protein